MSLEERFETWISDALATAATAAVVVVYNA